MHTHNNNSQDLVLDYSKPKTNKKFVIILNNHPFVPTLIKQVNTVIPDNYDRNRESTSKLCALCAKCK